MPITDARGVTLALLEARALEGTVCPSEVARAMAAPTNAEVSTVSWREMMPAVHAAVDRMVYEGLIRLSWKGQELTARAGPYRIGRGAHDHR